MFLKGLSRVEEEEEDRGSRRWWRKDPWTIYPELGSA